jgi:ATP-dependent protease HslVU (ClpYQ) peptidase subunit
MTVCIGAICGNGKAAVVAADKMVTFGPPMLLQTEPPATSKVNKLTDESVLLFSGSVPDGEAIMALVSGRATTPPVRKVAELGEVIQQAYVGFKRRRVEDTILKPLLGADYDRFQALVAQSPSSAILVQTMGLIMQHNLQLDILLVGTDDTGSHLFVVTHPGVLLSLNTTGFAAIGTGGLHAGVRMSLAQHTKDASLVETIYNVYEAKRAAEVAPGVGKLTDLAVITNGAVKTAEKSLLDTLDQLHKPTLSVPELKRLREACDEWIGKAGN